MDRKARAALVSVGSNTVLVALKLFVGLSTGAVSVVSEAIHSGVDLLAAIMAFFAVRAAAQPADEDHAFGHHKYENLSAAIESALIFVAAGMIVTEALGRIWSPGEVPETTPGLVVMALSTLVNFLVSRYLFKVAKETDSAALRADAHHLSTDVYTGLGILAGLGLVKVTGLALFDGLTALGVAALIARIAWQLVRESAHALLDTSLPEEELGRLRALLDARVPPLVDYHDLKTRKAGSLRHIEVHLTFPGDLTVAAAHDVAEEIELAIDRELGNCSVITHLDATPLPTLATAAIEQRTQRQT